tara:strand:- start:201 stop:1724 length:1524 start_codon:yes stop_codon:yes gene_type:complete
MEMSAQGLYTQMCGDRHSYLERARDAARVTIPTLVPDEGATSATKFPTPYQSIGARGVNNLASALLLSLLPPNAPFFRLVLDEMAIKKIEGIEGVKTEIEDSLSEIERAVMREIEVSNIRVTVFEAVKQLIVAGNVLLYVPEDGNVRLFRLDRYAVCRDADGNIEKVITHETISPSVLPEYVRAKIDPSKFETAESIDLYTCCKRMPDGKFHIHQEVDGVMIEGTDGIIPADKMPFIALRMIKVDGDDYGRSYVEQYLGDLRSLEALTQAIVEGSAASAKVLFLVNPNSTTRARTLAESPNGAIREGNANDCSVLQVGKQADFSVALQTAQTISDRLAFAFLLTESTIRQAERVTAEEVRLVTMSIERQLGGVYSLLSQELQLPLVELLMSKMKKQKRLPEIPKNLVQAAVITGIEALGRGNDLNKLDMYLAGIAQILGPEMLGQFINMREYMDRRATALGIDTKGLVKSEEELQQEAQMQAQNATVQQFGPKVVEGLANQTMAPSQ